jgi:hypothetical protein
MTEEPISSQAPPNRRADHRYEPRGKVKVEWFVSSRRSLHFAGQLRGPQAVDQFLETIRKWRPGVEQRARNPVPKLTPFAM